MKTIDTLICARWVLPIAPKNKVLEDYAVAINNGRLIELLPIAQAQQKYQAKTQHQFNSHVLMPGLINAHTHTPMNLFRGLADDLPLMDWLQKHMWPTEQRFINEKSVALGSQLAIAEMLRGGTTCFNDHFFFQNITAEIAAKNGMRACIGLQMMDTPTQWAKNCQEGLQKGIELYQQWQANPLISWSLAPQGPYTINNEDLAAVKQASEKFDLPVHFHLHETQAEIQHSLDNYKMRPLARLHQLGLLSAKLMAVHMVHVNDAEIKLCQENKVHIVHCPEANMKLASGFVPMDKYAQTQLNIALGTDSVASNNDLDMFGEMRTTALVSKGLYQDPTLLPAAEVLEMATINGARALGREKEIGSLEAGKYADLIAIDLSSFLAQPVYNPMSHLIFATNRLQVSDVWIAGQHLLKDGEFTQLQVAPLLEQLQTISAKIQAFQPKSKPTKATS